MKRTNLKVTVTGVNEEILNEPDILLDERDRLLLTLLKFPFESKSRVDKQGNFSLLIPGFNSQEWWISDFFKYEVEFPELKL